MARRITWSRRAQEDRKQIFEYWNHRNKSKSYSKKLNLLFIELAELISIHVQIGRKTDMKGVRLKLVSHFALIYEYSEKELRILSIFDTRQNPKKLDDILET